MPIPHRAFLPLRACAGLLALLSVALRPSPGIPANPVRVAVYENPPIVSTDGAGRAKGLAVDVLEHIASLEGWTLEYVPGSWAEGLERVSAGDVDLLVAVAPSEARARAMDFSEETLLVNWGRILAPPAAGISSVLDLDGRRVAVLDQDIFEGAFLSLARRFGIRVEPVRVGSYAEVVDAVVSGRAHAGVLNRLYRTRQGLAEGLEWTPVVFEPVEIRFAAPKGRGKTLLGAIDARLAELKGNPLSVYYRALERWLGDDTAWGMPRWVPWALGGMAGVLLLAFAFVVVLRRQVRTRTARIAEANRELEREVAERRKAEEALRDAKDTLTALIEASPAAIVAFDPQMRIRLWNRAAERLFGCRREEVIGRRAPYVPQDSRDEIEALLRRAFAGEPAQGEELAFRGRDGALVEISVSTAPVPGPAGGIHEVIAIILDITGRKRAERERRALEEKIQKTQKLESLGVLAGGIAHDFNNLLMGILGNADLALLRMPPESPGRPNVQAIDTAAQRAADLTNQLLAYSGAGRFVVERVDLNRLVEETAGLLRTVISKKVVLRFALAPDLPPVEADATQIRQVVMNLITNASEAIEDRNGMVTVSTGVLEADRAYLSGTYLDESLPEGRYVYLEVSDTGCGMDEETRARIFDPFFTTKFTGRGLGLAAVLGIVRGHGGAIKVYSEPGRGTSVKVLLPEALGSIRESPEGPGSGRETWRGRGLVLVVDDDAPVRQVAAMMLEDAGFRVLQAADGREGVELFRSYAEEIAAVLLDLTMPRMSGEEAFREMRRIRPDVPVILSSGYNEQDATNRFAGKGIAGFIQKPYRSADLLAEIRKVLEGPPDEE